MKGATIRIFPIPNRECFDIQTGDLTDVEILESLISISKAFAKHLIENHEEGKITNHEHLNSYIKHLLNY